MPGQAPKPARYLDRREIVPSDICALRDRTMHGLADAENSGTRPGISYCPLQ